MKLRNKKTGKVQTCDMVVITDEKLDGAIASLNKHAFIFRSIEQFNDQYEAYKLAEPLIKDEKIRKAVRAWAGAVGVDKVIYEDSGWYYEYFRTEPDEYDHAVDIDFWHKLDADLCSGNTYTIAELCGEEEE